MTVETSETTHAPLQEVDFTSPENDHLGDYREMQSPYEASIAAQKLANVEVPDEAHADPGEVKEDVAAWGAKPYAVMPVRNMPSDSWAANDFLLVIGENRAVCVAEYDPYRKRLVITNRTNDVVFISPNPNGAPGWGSTMLPGQGGQMVLETKARVFLFTVTGYNPGVTQNVSVVTERYA